MNIHLKNSGASDLPHNLQSGSVARRISNILTSHQIVAGHRQNCQEPAPLHPVQPKASAAASLAPRVCSLMNLAAAPRTSSPAPPNRARSLAVVRKARPITCPNESATAEPASTFTRSSSVTVRCAAETEWLGPASACPARANVSAPSSPRMTLLLPASKTAKAPRATAPAVPPFSLTASEIRPSAPATFRLAQSLETCTRCLGCSLRLTRLPAQIEPAFQLDFGPGCPGFHCWVEP